jgi:hypothetical protein
MGTAPALFQPRDQTTGSVIRFEGTLPNGASPAEQTAFAALVKEQQYFLESALGLVTNVLGRDPGKWAKPDQWQSAWRNLPDRFYTSSAFDRHGFQERLAGVQFPDRVLNRMVPWASTQELTGSFMRFLMTIGDQIRSGVRSGAAMETYHVVFGYQPIRNPAGTWELVSTADCYFASVTDADRSIYSSCASMEYADFNLQFLKGTVSLNAANLSDARFKAERDTWTQTLEASSDDLSKAKNYFSSKASPN